jgi:hypothetical protein
MIFDNFGLTITYSFKIIGIRYVDDYRILNLLNKKLWCWQPNRQISYSMSTHQSVSNIRNVIIIIKSVVKDMVIVCWYR